MLAVKALFFAFSMVVMAPFVHASPIKTQISSSDHSYIQKCISKLRSPQDPRWVDLERVIELLDFSKRPSIFDDQAVNQLNSENLNLAMQARLTVITNIYHQAAKLDSVQLLVTKFDELSAFPIALYERHEILDRQDLMLYMVRAKSDIDYLRGQGLALTLLSLTNLHPSLMLNEPRLIPFIAKVLFAPKATREISPVMPQPEEFRKTESAIQKMLYKHQVRLLNRPRLAFATFSNESIQVWQQQLSYYKDQPGGGAQRVTRFAAMLGIEMNHKPQALNR